MPSAQLDREVRSVAFQLLKALDTPVSLSVWLLIENGEWDQLTKYRVDPAFYLDTVSGTSRFARDYQAASFLRKYEGLPTSFDKKEIARNGFYSSEAQCFATNRRLDPFLFLPAFLAEEDVRILEFIKDVRRIVRQLLGRKPSRFSFEPRFGPGTTFELHGKLRGRRLTLGDKLLATPTATPHAKETVTEAFGLTLWHRAHACDLLDTNLPTHLVDTVPGNRFTTVPKDSSKDRGICIEPGLNVWYQLGVGAYLKRRLARNGLLLPHGESESIHWNRAKIGSVSDDFATIDLSSASDTVSTGVVKLLLPTDWYDLLDSLRCKKTYIDGKWVKLEKFSSMGNGFTFELETIVFYALARAICGEDATITVYGDDIIVPSEYAEALLSALKWFGFTPNPKKTFLQGPFRESCGGDYFNGFLVTPYYLKEIPNEPQHWIGIANGLYRASGFTAHTRWSPYFRARFGSLGNVPTAIRTCIGPVTLGDILIHDHPSRWSYVVRNSQRFFRVYRPVYRVYCKDKKRFLDRRVNLDRFPDGFQLALALSGAVDTGPRGNTWAKLVPRDAVTGYRFGRVAYS